MFIGLTPFLYLNDTAEKGKLQDGKLHRKVAFFSCNPEKVKLSCEKRLTGNTLLWYDKFVGPAEKPAVFAAVSAGAETGASGNLSALACAAGVRGDFFPFTGLEFLLFPQR